MHSDDRPQPLVSCWTCWVAVSTGDQAGVMDVLGLTQPRPVTFAKAAEVIEDDAHGGPDTGADPFTRVVVTPDVDGWILVIGPWCDPSASERSKDVLRLCLRLSVRHGRAQAYYYGAQGDGSAWLVTQDGCVVRRYAAMGEAEDELLTLGEPLPLERARRMELGLPPECEPTRSPDDEWTWEAFEMAPQIAKALGVSPLTLTAETPRRGTCMIALTPYAAALDVER